MSNTAFINSIASHVKRLAPLYGICVYSPIIAQAILESASGTSELAVMANNFFGLKWRENRCPTSCGDYIKIGSEQNADGSYSSSTMKWFKFPNIEAGVQGYFDFINISRYANLKGITDPKAYLETIKADGYATSLNYVENLLAVIERYDLTRFDSMQEEENMNKPIIVLDAGHGLKTSGKEITLNGYAKTKEWWLNDRIADLLENMLKGYDCRVIRVDDTTGAKDVTLADRVKAANNGNADVYISIHHNAGIKGGTGGGTVVFYYPTGNCKEIATRLYNSIVAATGLRGNRSTPVANGKNLYVVRKTKMTAFLIENGFMDSKTDVPIILTESHAQKSAQGILNFLVKEYSLKPLKAVTSQNTSTTDGVKMTYKVQCGAFSVKENAENLCNKLKADGYNAIVMAEPF